MGQEPDITIGQISFYVQSSSTKKLSEGIEPPSPFFLLVENNWRREIAPSPFKDLLAEGTILLAPLVVNF